MIGWDPEKWTADFSNKQNKLKNEKISILNFLFFARTSSKLYNNHATTATLQNTHFILICFCLLEKNILEFFFVQYIFYLLVSKATVKTRQRLVIHNPVFLTFFLSWTKKRGEKYWIVSIRGRVRHKRDQFKKEIVFKAGN